MQKISAGRFFYKRLFPLLWFGSVALFVLLGARSPVPLPILLLLPLVLTVVGYVVLRNFVWDLADEVWDGGDYLLVKKGRVQERVSFSNIINVNAIMFANPPRIVLRLAQPGKFGSEIAFSPSRSSSLNPFAPSPLVDDLILRVDRARRSH